MRVAVIDFETEAIESRPHYPPTPVGVSIEVNARAKYFAWGHPTENNCTKAQAVRALKNVWCSHQLVFHNAMFDIEVAMVHMGLCFPDVWDDTMLLLYLLDPRRRTLSLKPSAAIELGLPPEEQDAVRDWILEHIPESKPNGRKFYWAKYICLAPGDLVGKYAQGDTTRTRMLYRKCIKQVRDGGMLKAYERDKHTARIALGMEQRGIPIAERALKRDRNIFLKATTEIEKTLQKKLRTGDAPINLNSSKQLVDALTSAKLVKKFILTDKGNPSVSRSALQETCTDKSFVDAFNVWSVLNHYVTTFFNAWIQATDNGYLHPQFHTTRDTGEQGAKGFGTRTGRLSSTAPNFMAVPADVRSSKDFVVLNQVMQYLKPFGIKNFLGMRDYIRPKKGQVLLARDYSQQELRVFAHYEDDELLRAYLDNPNLDIHKLITTMVNERMHESYVRKFIKIVVFALLYGRGQKALALQLGTDIDTAIKVKRAVLKTLPGVERLNTELKDLALDHKPLRTFGGRLYYCEEPKVIAGSQRTFYYKMLNLLVQGSSADITKEAMVRTDAAWDSAKLILQVHDELLGVCPREHAAQQMQVMKESMESVELDVPLLTDGSVSSVSWARMKECD